MSLALERIFVMLSFFINIFIKAATYLVKEVVKVIITQQTNSFILM